MSLLETFLGEASKKFTPRVGDKPRKFPSIENDHFWDKDDSSLAWIAKDARKAMEANPDNPKNTSGPRNYADQIADSATVRAWRQKQHSARDIIFKKPVKEEMELTEELRLKASDKKVIKAFTDKQSASSKKLETDGKKLDGLWMGGSKIAHWEDGKIHLNDVGSKSGQTVHRVIRLISPKNWMAEAYNRKADQGTTGDREYEPRAKGEKKFKDAHKVDEMGWDKDYMKIKESASLVQHAWDENPQDFKDAFDASIRSRIGDAIESLKVNMFEPEMEDFEDVES